MTERQVPALAGSETDAGTPPVGTASGSTASASASLTRSWAGETALPAIELSGVVKEFHARGEVVTAVAGIDLDIREGEFFSLLGPSGCGKTTTLRMIAGFEEPTEGGSCWTARTSRTSRRTSATSTWCSSPTPCSRT